MSSPVPTQDIQTAAPPAPWRVLLPELLAPAGDWECARAAVENGADAIYFGLEKFNARMRAHNFTEADLPKLMEFLHRRGVKGYVTFNTLVFENELAEAEQYAHSIIMGGADAAIVQDVGIVRMIRRISPDFPVHVSTQMTVTSAQGVRFARELGCNLVVLARECSLKELQKIQTAQSGEAALPLEVFVHGALCVAYSGQCLTSESLGGRSANRGECAQACRMPYELLADDKPVPLGDRRYLLSPQDLAGVSLLPELNRLGIASLKIEGRLKSAEYVANITRVYRQALERIAAGGASDAPQTDRYDMEMAFSRGLYTGWFGGTNNQELVHGRFGTKRGVFLGEVGSVRRDGVTLKLQAELKPGDGVVFDAGRPDEKEEGGRVYAVRPLGHSREVFIGFGRDDVDLHRVRPGNKLWKTSDPALEKRLRQSFEGDTPRFQRSVTWEVHGARNRPLTLFLRDEEGRTAQVTSSMPLVPADKQPLSEDKLRDQLGRLGGTPFRLGRLVNRLDPGLMLPVSELNRMRRSAVQELEQLRSRPLRWTLRDTPVITEAPRTAVEPVGTVELIALVRQMPQLEAAWNAGVRTIYCDFEDPKKYREAVSRVRELSRADDPGEIWVAPPRIFKMGEDWTLKQVRSSEADGYLVRNYDHLDFFAEDRKRGDYSLNVSNHLTAEYFIDRYRLERLTVSYDLNIGQVEALLKGSRPGTFELTLHQHMPMFHMEHCVFCAFLSKGTDYTNCGRPCDRHDLKLRDRVGAEHPVKADAGCRNTVYNSLAQTGAEYFPRVAALGVRHFRVEFVNETPEQVARTLSKYRQLVRGEITGPELWRELKLFHQLGVTRGQM